MGQTAEELRQDIADTRDNLSDTLDAIGDRVSPGRVIERRKNRMTAGVHSALERVMGSAHDAADAVRDAPSSVGSGTQGRRWSPAASPSLPGSSSPSPSRPPSRRPNSPVSWSNQSRRS